MTDPDRRVHDALEGLPSPGPESTRRAREAALGALPPGPRRRRRRPWPAVAAATAAAALVAGVALAATDRIAVRIGPEPEPRPAVAASDGGIPRLALPPGMDGLALVQGGRLWLATRSGLGVQGLPVSTAELSPRALYAVVGIGRALVAVAPDGRKAWTHQAGGTVVAASWAPNPIVIAYVVRRGARHELRVIDGDGDGDRLVDPDVAPVRPSWRADTQALAYADRGRRLAIADYPSLARRATLPSPRPLAAVTYAPSGDRIAVAGSQRAGALAIGTAEGLRWSSVGPGIVITALTWATDGTIAAAGRPVPARRGDGRVWTIPAGETLGKPSATAHGPVVEALSSLGEGRLVAAVRDGAGASVWEIAAPPRGRDAELRPASVVLRIPHAGGGVQALSGR